MCSSRNGSKDNVVPAAAVIDADGDSDIDIYSTEMMFNSGWNSGNCIFNCN